MSQDCLQSLSIYLGNCEAGSFGTLESGLIYIFTNFELPHFKKTLKLFKIRPRVRSYKSSGDTAIVLRQLI